MSTAAKGGLEDVVATSSAICFIDGERGVLSYAGYDIHDLAQSATFEEVCYLLWHRRLPNRAELGDLPDRLHVQQQVDIALRIAADILGSVGGKVREAHCFQQRRQRLRFRTGEFDELKAVEAKRVVVHRAIPKR